MRVIEKTWNEFWAYHWRIRHRHTIPGIFEWDEKLASFIESVLSLSPGQRVLDLACGGGDQAIVFARKGYDVVGVEVSPPLVEHARKRFEKEGLRGTFLAGDMRDINYNEEFEACLILSGSFGFFGDKEDARFLSKVYEALRPGGRVFIMFVSPVGESTTPVRTWREIEEGWELDETWFEPASCLRCGRFMIVERDGTMVTLKREHDDGRPDADEIIRCYTVPEMKRMLEDVGFRYLSAYGNDLSLPVKPLSSTENARNVAAVKPD